MFCGADERDGVVGSYISSLLVFLEVGIYEGSSRLDFVSTCSSHTPLDRVEQYIMT